MSQENEFGEIAVGFFTAILLNVVGGVFFGIIAGLFASLQLPQISTLFLFLAFGIGLSQLIYIIPIVVRYRRRRQWGRMKGVIIGAVFTALLSGGCFLVFSGTLR
jgi:threonine/homoserine/homoserine lactone efflux protein